MTNESHKTIATALAKAQSTMGKAMKSATNPHFNKNYADLASVVDACMPALNECGIAVIQPTTDDENGRFVETILIHGESGEELKCRVPLIVSRNDMQGYGSAVTYARRYGLMSMAGIAPEDDDGNAAAKAAPTSDKAAPVIDHNAAFKRSVDDAKKAIAKEETLEDLAGLWGSFERAVQHDESVIKCKNDRKAALAPPASSDITDDEIPY